MGTDDDTFRAALDAAKRELADLEAKSAQLRPRLDAAQRTVIGLEAVLGITHPVHQPYQRQLGTTDRVAQLFTELQRPMTLREVFVEFERRSWVDTTWQAPEAAVGQAVRRAADGGKINRVSRGLWGPIS